MPVILKIYDIKTDLEADPSRELNCLGVATRSSGDELRIKFYLEKDKDGDYFNGYEPV